MKRYFFVFVTAFSLACGLGAHEDFIGLLINDIEKESSPSHAKTEEYNCITVSPTMIDKVLDVADESEDKDTEQLKKILPHIKSLRIFETQQKIHYYDNAIRNLLTKNKARYKSYRAYRGQKDSNVWLRKNNDNVIEIIILSNKEDKLKVVNFTGNMTTDFVTELMKM